MVTGEKMTLDPSKALDELSRECSRLRSERDDYRSSLEDLQARALAEHESRLRLLAVELNKQIREDFLSSLKTGLWIAAIIGGIATLGGFLSLSDIITTRVNNAVESKQAEFDRLRETILNSIVDLKVKSAEAVEDVSTESEKAKQQIQRHLTVVALNAESGEIIPQRTGFPAIMGTPGSSTTVTIFGSGDGVSFESAFDGVTRGEFAHWCEAASLSDSADINQDRLISAYEAVARTKNLMTAAGSHSEPVVTGGTSKTTHLFRTSSGPQTAFSTAHILTVGIAAYPTSPLAGPVNDIQSFRRLAETRLAAKKVMVTELRDTAATRSAILEALRTLKKNATADDLVLFYYSGHVTSVPDIKGAETSGTTKALAPYDYANGSLILLNEIIETLNGVTAKGRVVVIT